VPLSSFRPLCCPKTSPRLCDPRGLTLTKSVVSRPCCHLRLTRCSHGLLRLWAFTHVRDFSRPLAATEVTATRDASTALNVTAFPQYRLRDTAVTVWTPASFRTAGPRRSKPLRGLPNTEVLSIVACDRSLRHLAFARPSPRPS
jgi:hypothetical protein